MRKLRRDFYRDATLRIQQDLSDMQISQRCAASYIGIAHSTFNAFLNQEYTRPNPKTIAKLLATPVWKEATLAAILALHDYENCMFANATSTREKVMEPHVNHARATV